MAMASCVHLRCVPATSCLSETPGCWGCPVPALRICSYGGTRKSFTSSAAQRTPGVLGNNCKSWLSIRAQAQPEERIVDETNEGSIESVKENEGVGALTVGIVAPEISIAAIESVVNTAASSSAVVGIWSAFNIRLSNVLMLHKLRTPILENLFEVLIYRYVQIEDEAFVSSGESCLTKELESIYATMREWKWRGYSIAYTVHGCGPPVLLVHGFGASIGHWRRYTVYPRESMDQC